MSTEENVTAPVKSRRGRKPKKISSDMDDTPPVKKTNPRNKNNKIIYTKTPSTYDAEFEEIKVVRRNIILHLKCHCRDLIDDTCANNTTNTNIVNTTNNTNNLTNVLQINPPENNTTTVVEQVTEKNQSDNLEEIYAKLHALKVRMHLNNIDMHSHGCCFRCTYPFDNPPIHIPYEYINKRYNVYGIFCSPECAAGYLFEEHLDISVRFERYYYLNQLYKDTYQYTDNIKPSPKPQYTLERFMGTLTIHEYRKLAKGNKVYTIINKPMTPVLPEMHEENGDLLLHQRIIPAASAANNINNASTPFSNIFTN